MKEGWEKETLQAVTIFGFFTHDVENGIDQLSTLSVMSFSPVITGTRLTKDEVVGPEDLAVRAGSDAVHGAGLEIHEDSPRNITATGSLVEIDIDAFQLKIIGAISPVTAGWINPVFVADYFPEFGTNLIPALTSLNVQDFPHFFFLTFGWEKIENVVGGGRSLFFFFSLFLLGRGG